VALFRAGHDDAFRVIHDRYRQRLFAYTRQMLPRRQDAEDALQDVFVRAYSGLLASQGQLVLRAWLYRIAHNRCIDELRRPAPPPPELLEIVRPPVHDPIAAADQRESLRRLVADVRRLPDQQRSALLMRELGGMAYADMALALGVTGPAVKSLLVRARIALAQALEARDTACSEIRGQLTLAHDRGVRPSGTARRHMRDCNDCRHFHRELRGVSRRFAALAPTIGPLGVIAKLLGFGGGAGGSAAAGGGAVAAGGAAGTGGAIASVGLFAGGAGHVATLIAAAVVTAGGAVEIQHSVAATPMHHRHHVSAPASAPPAADRYAPAVVTPAVRSAAPAASSVAVVPAHRTAVHKASSVQVKPASHPGKSPATRKTHHLPQSTPAAGSSTSGGATAPGGTKTTTLPDGTQITTLPDGTQITVLDLGNGDSSTPSSTAPSTTDPTSGTAQPTATGSSSGDGAAQPTSGAPTSSTSTGGSGSPPASTGAAGSSAPPPATGPVVIGQ
jgi:RNA polymerase sigma factor (sigma-70 family)